MIMRESLLVITNEISLIWKSRCSVLSSLFWCSLYFRFYQWRSSLVDCIFTADISLGTIVICMAKYFDSSWYYSKPNPPFDMTSDAKSYTIFGMSQGRVYSYYSITMVSFGSCFMNFICQSCHPYNIILLKS